MLFEDSKKDTWMSCFERWKRDTWWNMKGWLWRVTRDTCVKECYFFTCVWIF